MFFVVNKDKIMAFVVACCTVFVLFLMTSMFAKTPTTTIETSTQISTNIETTETIEENNNKTNNNEI